MKSVAFRLSLPIVGHVLLKRPSL